MPPRVQAPVDCWPGAFSCPPEIEISSLGFGGVQAGEFALGRFGAGGSFPLL